MATKSATVIEVADEYPPEEDGAVVGAAVVGAAVVPADAMVTVPFMLAELQ